jgi:hypothetical protein
MQRSPREIREKITELRDVLESGVTEFSVDGTTTKVDLDVVRRQIASLESQLPEGRKRRPRAARIRLDT